MWALLLLVACRPAVPTQAPMRGLSPTEYNNTVRDLLAMPLQGDWPEASDADDEPAWPWDFPAELGVNGFDGMADGQVESPYQIEQLQRAAVHFAPYIEVSPAFSACDADYTACAWPSVARFANRAYRRPLHEDERRRLKRFHDGNVARHGVRQGTVLTVAGVLQAPQFLYRIEVGEPRLDSWETASRLSYFLWDSMPDPTLFQAAANDALATPDQVEAQARRMLKDPRARDMVTRFHRQWLDIDRIHLSRPDKEAYAEKYGPEVAYGYNGPEMEEIWSALVVGFNAGMVREVDLFVEEQVFDRRGGLADLLTSSDGYTSAIHSQFLDGPSTTRMYGDVTRRKGPTHTFTFHDGNRFDVALQPVTYPPDERAGLLTLAGVVASRAHPVHPAPILRGVFLLERVTCTEIGEPIPGALDLAPVDDPKASGTNRQRVEAATSPPACQECHGRVNPLGFAFENYDSMGGYRGVDNKRRIDASGEVTLGNRTLQFADGVDLSRQLARERLVRDCYVQHWTRYALGREEIEAERAEIEALQADLRPDAPVLELLVKITQLDAFRHRRPR